MWQLNIYSLGGVDGEVTGSCHIIEYKNKKENFKYMIDCGLHQGGENPDLKNRAFKTPFNPNELSCMILTHAHADHCGLLPRLVKEGYTGKIHSIPATRDLASIIMLDSAKIQSHEEGVPAYTEKDVIETMNHFSCFFYGKHKRIDDNVTATFYNAGHILGSAMIDLEFTKYSGISRLFHKKDEKTHILYTGDLGRESNPLVNPPATDMPAPDYIVMESTYGNKTHESLDTVYQELAYNINRTIERGGKVIIPSFAIERAQELIYFIKNLMHDNKIPRVPVYVDSPMAVNATGVFSIHSECFNNKIKDDFISKGKNPFSVKSLKYISSYQESLQIARSKKPCIVISAQGMCEAGRIINHIKHGIGNPNNTILIVGYMCEGTLGRKILNKAESVMIDDKEYKLKAEVQQINAFSAHADYREMLDWLGKIDTSKLKKIYLVHGDHDAQEFFVNKLRSAGFPAEIIKAQTRYKL